MASVRNSKSARCCRSIEIAASMALNAAANCCHGNSWSFDEVQEEDGDRFEKERAS